MKKTQFENEISLSTTCKKGSSGADVKRIQEWLNIHALHNTGSTMATSVDGDFGAATELAVMNFQQANGKPKTGIVDQHVFDALCAPMIGAYKTTINGGGLRDTLLKVAHLHCDKHPIELQINGSQNLGPWVRSYCQGNEGNDWLWCMGFVQTIFDQATEVLGEDFTTIMPLTYSCDVVAQHAKQKQQFIANSDVRNNPGRVKPGDIFLVQKTSNDWVHTGIISGVNGDCFETIEGNTNTGGSSNGTGVFKRARNFMLSKLDVFSIEAFV